MNTNRHEYKNMAIKKRKNNHQSDCENNNCTAVILDENIRMQIFVIEYLFNVKDNEDGRSVTSDELIQNLTNANYPSLSKQQFSSKIIGKLRDAGIILSSSNAAYTFATTLSEIYQYINHDKSIIEPMLGRLQKARSFIKQQTTGRFDILGQFQVLQSILDAFAHIHLDNITIEQPE